jgi:NAD(P)-dependent dehydrogenase (short-subunit alcohol dehydrogenase family)
LPLTGLLLERLLATPGSRIVTVSSIAHRRGVIHFDDLHSQRRYDPADAYAQSKLANLLFSYQLHARLQTTGARTIALAAHPGNARTGLWRTSSRLERALLSPRMRPLNFWLMQSAQLGALPILRAAVDPSARGGESYGPAGRLQYTGHPTRVASSPARTTRRPSAGCGRSPSSSRACPTASSRRPASGSQARMARDRSEAR